MEKIKQAMAKKFGITLEKIIDFPFGDETVIMHGGLSGIYKGSYNDIFNAPKKDYEIRVGNKRYDTRQITEDIYGEFIRQWKGSPMPDSNDLLEWTDTWLKTDADRDVAVVGRVDGGGLCVGLSLRDFDLRNCRFRPAVVVYLSSDISPSFEISKEKVSQDLQTLLDKEYKRGWNDHRKIMTESTEEL